MLNHTDRRFHWAWLSEHNDVLRHDMRVLNGLLNQIGGNQFVDLGCFIGGFTQVLATHAQKRGGKVYSVDLYKQTKGGLDFCMEHLNYPCKEYFIENMNSVGLMDVINLHEGCSWEYADRFDDESVDFIWIDASHIYPDVIRDIRNWYPKLRKGGIIAGHDYSDWGVEMSVREFFPFYVVYPTRNDCWAVKKG